MRATRRTSPASGKLAKVDIVVLDAAWGRVMPGVARLVRKAARAAIRGAEKSLTVALADDRRVRALNKRHAAKDKPTNVLSYPSSESAFLGDIVLARQTVWREARMQNKTPADHLAHLVVHGTLHLQGHDHETSEADAERMEALERRILAKLGIADPY